MRIHPTIPAFHPLPWLLLTACTLSAQDPAAPKVKPLDSTITAVTVYADRARVTREARLALPAETTRFSFAKLPSWIHQSQRPIWIHRHHGLLGLFRCGTHD